MQNKHNKISKLTSGLLSLGVVATSFAGYHFINNTKSAVPYNVYAEQSELTSITNADFYYGNSSTPSKPSSGWDDITNKGVQDDSIVSGIFNHKTYLSSQESYLENHKLLDIITPGNMGSDEGEESNAEFKSLMINSPISNGNHGYRTNSSISLEANSYYAFGITFKTMNNVLNPDSAENGYADKFDSFASIYLNGLSSGTVKAEKLKSNLVTEQVVNGWVTYTIFVATNEFSGESNLNLELWLGTQNEGCVGPVYFNNVTLTRYSKATFEHEVDNMNDSSKTVVRLNSTNYLESVTNYQFDYVYTNGWTDIEVCTDENNGQVIASVDLDDRNAIKDLTGEIDASYKLTDADIPTSTNLDIEASRNVLLINNPLDTHTALIQSEDINIIQHGYYKISVYMWRNSSSGSPVIKLIDVDGNVDEVSQSATATTSSDKFIGKWTEYSFYVEGSAYASKTVALQLGLNSKGYVYFDDVTIQQVSYADYQTGSSKSNAQTMSFDISETNYQIKNDEFDQTSNATYDVVYPLAPREWTANVDENATKSGVINTDTLHFNDNIDNYSKDLFHPYNPGPIDTQENNNVLMIGNLEEDLNNYYTSSEVSLSASSYYHFTAYVSANSLTGDNGAYIKFYSSNQSYFEYSNIRGAWQKVELYIATGEDSITANLDLGMTAQGYAFFDKIQMETSSQDIFDAVKLSGSATIVDLSSESFENYIQDASVWKFDAVNFGATNVGDTTVESGVADLSKHQFDGVATQAYDGHNVLYIRSDEDSYYYFESSNAYTFSADSTYKLSLFVQTHLYEQDPDSVTEDSKYGASITLNYGDNSKTFYAIDTNTALSNGWVEYAFYIKTDSEITGTLELALGSDKGNTSGLVMFDKIALTKIEDSEFDEAEEGDTVSVIDLSTPSKSDSGSKTSNLGGFSWYLVPSLITALAIFIAIIGTLVKKINWKRSPKVQTTYDRAKTLDKDLSTREQISAREKLIAEFKTQIVENDTKIAEFKKQSKTAEQELKAKLDDKNKELIDNLKTIAKEREHVDAERNALLAKDKASYTAEQDKQYKATIKSIDKAEKKYSAKLKAKEQELTNLQEKNNATLNSYMAENASLKNEIKTLTKEIESYKREELKRLGVKENKIKKEDVEIITPDE